MEVYHHSNILFQITGAGNTAGLSTSAATASTNNQVSMNFYLH